MVYKRRNFEFLLHLDAKNNSFKLAKSLRRKSTNAEKALWQELKAKRFMGLKFRRQHPIHFYIADFYCHELKLIIEVDGGIHLCPKTINHDLNRVEELSRFGVDIIRFKNEEVLYSLENVKTKLKYYILNKTIE